MTKDVATIGGRFDDWFLIGGAVSEGLIVKSATCPGPSDPAPRTTVWQLCCRFSSLFRRETTWICCTTVGLKFAAKPSGSDGAGLVRYMRCRSGEVCSLGRDMFQMGWGTGRSYVEINGPAHHLCQAADHEIGPCLAFYAGEVCRKT